MGFLKKLFGNSVVDTPRTRASAPPPVRTRESSAPPPERKYSDVVDARDQSKLPEEAVLLGGQDRVEVRGESHYQDALDKVCGGRCEEGHKRKVYAALDWQPDNPYDKNAIAIRVDGEMVGHMAKESAAKYAPIVKIVRDAGKIAYARAFIRGGWSRQGDEGHYGIELELSTPEALMKTRKVQALLKVGG